MNRLAALVAACVPLVAGLAGCEENKPDQVAHVVPDEADAPAEDPANDTDDGRTWKANDSHTHLSAEAYPLAMKLFDQNGIYRVVNMSGGHAPARRADNLAAAEPYGDRLAHFFNVDWRDVDDADFGQAQADALEAAVAQGYAGLKISKALGLGVRTDDGELLPVDSPRLDPLWARAGKLGVPVGIHTSDPKAFFEKPGPDNERWDELELAPSWSFYGEEYPSRKALLDARDRMVARHPDTTFILLHFANNPEDIDYVDRLLDAHPNVVVDVSARIAEIGRHDPDRVRELFVKHQDRILFATDLGVRVKHHQGKDYYRLTLGSISKEPPTLEDVRDFYDDHWRYFESDVEAIAHPVPIQGDWKVHPIDLPAEVRDKVYFANAERVVFAPWMGRRTGHAVVEHATAAASH